MAESKPDPSIDIRVLLLLRFDWWLLNRTVTQSVYCKAMVGLAKESSPGNRSVRRKQPLYTAAQLRLALEGRSPQRISPPDHVMRPEFLRRVQELQIQTQLIYDIFFGDTT